jgi:hypothetical protein
VGPRSSQPFQHNQLKREEVGPRSFQQNQPTRKKRWDLRMGHNQFTSFTPCTLNINIFDTLPSHGVKPTWRFHKVKLRKVKTWRHGPGFQLKKGVEGRVGSPGIRLGRGTSRSSLNLHQNKPPTWLVHIPGHPWVLGQATGNWTHLTHHGPDSGEATTSPL